MIVGSARTNAETKVTFDENRRWADDIVKGLSQFGNTPVSDFEILWLSVASLDLDVKISDTKRIRHLDGARAIFYYGSGTLLEHLSGNLLVEVLQDAV